MLFALTGVLTFSVGLFCLNSTLDINMHDTYFLISYLHVGTVLALTFLSIALIYFMFKRRNRPLYRRLGLTHYVLSILPIFAATLINFEPQRHLANQDFSEEMANVEKFNIVLSASLFLCLLGQVLFVTNIILTLLRKNAGR